MININFKTTICSHYRDSEIFLFFVIISKSHFFKADGLCERGINCHFAHSESELRKRSDPLPENTPLLNVKRVHTTAPLNIPPNVNPHLYKTQMCKFFEKGTHFGRPCLSETGECSKGSNCTYGHSVSELQPRAPMRGGRFDKGKDFPDGFNPMGMGPGGMPMWPSWPQATIDENDPKVKNAISLKQIEFIHKKLKELFKGKERFNASFDQAQAKIDEKSHGEAATALDVIYF
jgi:hypothetical protein